MPHQHSSLDKQVDKRNLLETLKSLSKEDLYELCILLIPPSDRPNTATDIRTLAVEIFKWAEALTGCGLSTLKQEVEILTGKNRISVNGGIAQELRYLDFRPQSLEFKKSLRTNNSKAFIIHNHRERIYFWLLNRFLFRNDRPCEELPKIYPFPMKSLSSSTSDAGGIWEDLYRQLGNSDPFCENFKSYIFHQIETALYTSEVFFIVDGIEITNDKFVIDLIDNFWLKVVDRLIQIRHSKKERLFLFLVDSSHGDCQGFFQPGHPLPAKPEWSTREFVSFSRTQPVGKLDFEDWLESFLSRSVPSDQIKDMADEIYGQKTECEIDEIAEKLVTFLPTRQEEILGMLNLKL